MHTAFRSLFCVGVVMTISGCPTTVPKESDPNALLIFHNGTGPMCIEALEWLATMQTERPGLVVEEHLTTDVAGLALLGQLTLQYGQSQGVSTTFGYLPIIFFKGQAFSGFNDKIQQSLAGLIESMNAPSP